VTPANRALSTVERAVLVLRVMANSPEDLGNNEIARRSGINPSTVSRLLGTLETEGVVRRMPQTGRFRLGPLLVELGNAALERVDVRELAHPHLVALMRATGETATLSVTSSGVVTTADFAQSPASVRSVAQLGRPSVAHATATGKVLLAYGGGLPAAPLPSFTSRTVTDPEVLASEIELIHRRGWAQAVGERELDLNAIAAPVLNSRGDLVAILGLQGPAARFGVRSMRSALDELLTRAAELSAACG